ncbi:MAG TPA: DNA repair protein RecN [Candidatus Udaeobacter sp.]|jgi:DNA repair protein RecN (Recombination protein N)|nr:DNA repair protein RecN [Candidatus Udaeobacter sp.]
MLERIRIKDLALVEEAELSLEPGLNVVTGETGAGKTLLVQAIHLLVGGKADADVVREGATVTIVEGEFRLAGENAKRIGELLASWSVELEGDALIVRREVQSGGRSRATVNQSPVTQAALRRLGEILADLHGQHEHQSLLRADAGLELLDRLAGLGPERGHYGEALAAYREAAAEHERLEQSLATFAERRDYLAHAALELDQARLVAGEEERLEIESARLRHTDRLRELAAGAFERLSEGDHAALGGISAAAHACDHAAALDPSLGEARATLEEARIAAAEAARQLADYLSALDADPVALESIESRRELLSRLQRKYRRGIEELIAWQSELRDELASGEDAEGTLERAHERVREAARECRDRAAKLTRRRRTAAAEWSVRVTRDLRPLGLAAARLEFVVEPEGRGTATADESTGGSSATPVAESAREAESFGLAGVDRVSILFTANPGEPPRPLQKIASGGELSRVMLALKSALEDQDRVDLLLFDEVDSGIGGSVAHAVGERLRKLARHRQILCVTHLPMIAALASHHLRVVKRVEGGRTTARIERVRGDERIEELARMLAGDRATDTTLRQARELMDAPESGGRPPRTPSRAGSR